MKDLIEVYDGLLTPDQCQQWIDYMDDMEKNSILVQDKDDRHRIDHKYAMISHDYNLPAWSWIGQQFFGSIQNCINDYFNKYSILKADRFLLHDLKIKKIPPGGGFHRWHYENGDLISATRSFVTQLYLNTIDEAGETEFLYMSRRVNAVAGRLIIFPAGYSPTHRGNPPIGQDKYIATSWGVVQENGDRSYV